ncbi:UPF0545 protein C22orf39 homolog [Belonocnema kinseyi]|uniref:UPF0545 protein C22orf39 homolog n=1 Tax=Belonocnema kinseyi TaxID=2817044 RepID=UPI00143D203C|nr:UPF0545 protein C22orf39 homolog [Belonocnema kinseyi]
MVENNDFSENMQESEENEKEDERKIDSWMIRPCDRYRDEYKDCTSIKARFHQYFVSGKYADCSQWKIDFNNCEKWTSKKDYTAYQELVASETNRRLKRLRAHYANNVWKKRDKPPEDWNKPLPQWLQERNATSYLELKNRESKIEAGQPREYKMCTIL